MKKKNAKTDRSLFGPPFRFWIAGKIIEENLHKFQSFFSLLKGGGITVPLSRQERQKKYKNFLTLHAGKITQENGKKKFEKNPQSHYLTSILIAAEKKSLKKEGNSSKDTYAMTYY